MEATWNISNMWAHSLINFLLDYYIKFDCKRVLYIICDVERVERKSDLKKDEKLDCADTNTKFKAFLGRYFVQDMLQVCYEWGNLQKLKMFHPVLWVMCNWCNLKNW